MALPDVRTIATLNNVESPQPTRPTDTDIDESISQNPSSKLVQSVHLAFPALLNNGVERPRPRMGATDSGSGNNNSNSGNQNSVVVGGTSVDASQIFISAGRDFIINVSREQAEKSSTLNESLLKDSNSNISNHGTTLLQKQDLGLSTPNDTCSDEQTGSLTTLSTHEPTSTRADSPISPPIHDYTNRRHYAKSLAPAAKSQMKRITPENLKRHIPAITHERIVDYMCTSFFDSTIAIRLWRPSPSLYDSISNHTRNWTRNIYLGDVGVFDNDGGFVTFFNIFESKDINRNRGHEVPGNFIPYHKKLSEMSIQSDWYEHTLWITGFMKDKMSERSEPITLRFPMNSTKRSCSALHMRDGFHCLRIQESEEGGLKEYVRSQQAGWYDSLAKDLNDRYLAIITTSFRVKAWASVIATGSKKVGKVRLVHREIGQQQIYSWAPDDNEVLTRNGPSAEHIQKIGAYLQTLADGSEVVRKELETCHVVAVEAFYLHEKTSRGLHTNRTISQRATESLRSIKRFFR